MSESFWQIQRNNKVQTFPNLHLTYKLSTTLLLQAENKEKPVSQRKQTHLETLLSTIRSMGVSLDVWKSADNKKKHEWTSLMGGEKRKLLKKLPHEFDKVLPKDKAPAVQKLWNVSNRISHTKVHYLII